MLCGASVFGTDSANLTFEIIQGANRFSHGRGDGDSDNVKTCSPVSILKSDSTSILLQITLSNTTFKKSSDSISLKKTSPSAPSKYRKLAGTKRGKNRILFIQDFNIPDRIASLTIACPEQEQTNLVASTLRDALSIPESLQNQFNRDLYTIAARV